MVSRRSQRAVRDPFLDTNIFVYALLASDARWETADRIIAEPGVISSQVLNEFANVAHRKFRMSWTEVGELMAELQGLGLQCMMLTTDTNLLAIRLAARYQFAFYDALIVASALEAGCETLLTEDLTHGQIIEGRLTIQNPFRD